jgi:pimeloyl-ACP methyl ester carboxylesterase
MGLDDHVVYPDFDRKAAIVFPDHVGPVLIRDCGHFVQWEAGDIFNDLVLMFCADLLHDWREN